MYACISIVYMYHTHASNEDNGSYAPDPFPIIYASTQGLRRRRAPHDAPQVLFLGQPGDLLDAAAVWLETDRLF